MIAGGTVVVADCYGARREELAFALESHSNYRVEQAVSVANAHKYLSRADVVAIVCDACEEAANGYSLLRSARADIPSMHLAILLVVTPEASWARAGAWTHGADAVLNAPVETAELLSCIAACSRRRRMRLDAHSSGESIEKVRDRTTGMLATLLDAAHPGMLRLGDELAEFATELARDFDVQPEYLGELRRAARLHQLGRLIEPTTGWDFPDDASFSRLMAASGRLVAETPMLESTAELISGMGAHWDGSGIPSNVATGQIAMRSRILRVAADYLRHGGKVSRALANVAVHSGTLYDPAVVAELAGVANKWDTLESVVPHETVPLDRLTAGSVLARDLCTASGIKLLSAGAVLTPAVLRVIRERHATDPILHGIPTQRRLM
jgi:response regulator RpfG family c-di-GMP phosphodiesterase